MTPAFLHFQISQIFAIKIPAGLTRQIINNCAVKVSREKTTIEWATWVALKVQKRTRKTPA